MATSASIIPSAIKSSVILFPGQGSQYVGMAKNLCPKAKSLFDAGTTVIDARVANEYAEAHIKGAINVPYKEKSAKAANFDASQDSVDLSKLPADKSAGIVFYCNGEECWKGYKEASAAIKAGYKTVYWFRLGFPEWKAKGYPVE